VSAQPTRSWGCASLDDEEPHVRRVQGTSEARGRRGFATPPPSRCPKVRLLGQLDDLLGREQGPHDATPRGTAFADTLPDAQDATGRV
jgi:hypothetical protein